MSKSAIEYYFSSPKFLELLDTIRANKSSINYFTAPAVIAYILKLRWTSVDVIERYFETGKLSLESNYSSISIIDWKNKKVEPVANGISSINTFAGTKMGLLGLPDNSFEAVGVSINLSENTSRAELLEFIENNWNLIKERLDDNFTKRVKRETTIRRLDDWLNITEKMYLHENDPNSTHKVVDFAGELACDFKIDISEVYEHAKTYRKLMELKYPNYKPHPF